MGPLKQLALLAVLATAVYAQPRDKKSIGIFNIVKFPNDVCSSDQDRYGTCFTAEECSDQNGVASGSCAEGYGVCCVITLTCGGTSSANCTHLTQTASGNPSTNAGEDSVCSYTICPASSTINRIRLDFTAFNIGGPVAPTATDGSAAGTDGRIFSLGSCLGDRFTTSGTGGPYPVICGVNTGQHVILDTDGTACVTATFGFGAGNAMRSYDIHITQFDRLNEMGGPARCLQFFTGNTGTVRTFNWQANQAGTHLASQFYDVCVRRESGRCVLCWSPTNETPATPSDQTANPGNFGISNSNSQAGAAQSGAGFANCIRDGATDSQDHIIIPNGVAPGANGIPTGTSINSAMVDSTAGSEELQFPSIFCGRFLHATTGSTTDGTVCTRSRQFSKLGVRFDPAESVVAGDAGGNGNENSDEASGSGGPLGTQGFELGFEQLAC